MFRKVGESKSVAQDPELSMVQMNFKVSLLANLWCYSGHQVDKAHSHYGEQFA